MLLPKKHKPSSKPTRLTTITIAPSNCENVRASSSYVSAVRICGPSTPRAGELMMQISTSTSSACMIVAEETCQRSSQISMPTRPKRADVEGLKPLARGKIALLLEQPVGRQINLAVNVQQPARFGIQGRRCKTDGRGLPRQSPPPAPWGWPLRPAS